MLKLAERRKPLHITLSLIQTRSEADALSSIDHPAAREQQLEHRGTIRRLLRSLNIFVKIREVAALAIAQLIKLDSALTRERRTFPREAIKMKSPGRKREK